MKFNVNLLFICLNLSPYNVLKVKNTDDQFCIQEHFRTQCYPFVMIFHILYSINCMTSLSSGFSNFHMKIFERSIREGICFNQSQ